jgi:hypothetical protein
MTDTRVQNDIEAAGRLFAKQYCDSIAPTTRSIERGDAAAYYTLSDTATAVFQAEINARCPWNSVPDAAAIWLRAASAQFSETYKYLAVGGR